MKYLFYAASMCLVIFGALIFVGAKCAVHEIGALIVFLIAALFFIGAAVIDAIQQSSKSK